MKIYGTAILSKSLILVALTLPNLHCTKPAPSQADAARPSADDVFKAIEVSGLGLRFELPVTWKSHETNQGTVFFPDGDETAKSFSLLIQSIQKDKQGKPDPLGLKEQLINELKGMQSPGELLKTKRFEQAGLKGIRLETRFIRSGQNRHKDQILINKKNLVISISYNTFIDNYAKHLDVWNHLVKSLRSIDKEPKQKIKP